VSFTERRSTGVDRPLLTRAGHQCHRGHRDSKRQFERNEGFGESVENGIPSRSVRGGTTSTGTDPVRDGIAKVSEKRLDLAVGARRSELSPIRSESRTVCATI